MTLAGDANDEGNTGLAWLDDESILYEQLPAGSAPPLVRISLNGAEDAAVLSSVHPIWVYGLPDARGALVVGCAGSGSMHRR